jgi:hypothetical protein
MNKFDTVMLSRAEEYDAAKIKDILSVHFAALGVGADFFAGKKVAVKPNLVMKKEPDKMPTLTLPWLIIAISSMVMFMAFLISMFYEFHTEVFFAVWMWIIAAALFVDGKKALEGEPSGGQTGNGQRIDGGAAAGDGENRDTVLGAQANQILTGIGDGGGACVSDQRTVLAGEKPVEDALTGADVVMLVVADQLFFQSAVVQEFDGYTGILSGDEIHRRQRIHRAGREISQITDGRSHQIQNSAHIVSSVVGMVR